MIVIPACLESFRRIADKPNDNYVCPLAGTSLFLSLCKEALEALHSILINNYQMPEIGIVDTSVLIALEKIDLLEVL